MRTLYTRGLLYLGTERGVYLSLDGGAQWLPLQLNLPVTPVHGIVSEKNDLVIATHGRGFYVMDQARLLRQLGPGLTLTTRLFEPAIAVRSVSRGVTIDYSLAAAMPNLSLEILDEKGQMIRRISSAASPAAVAAADDEESGPPEPKLGTATGMNRHVWDMRSAPSRAFPGLIMYQATTRGPVVPPGRYK